jgi:hypothetical protein
MILVLVLAGSGIATPAAEDRKPVGTSHLRVDFAGLPTGGAPPNFRSALNGSGPPPVWSAVQVELTSGQQPAVVDTAERRTVETVVAQLSTDPTDERFPLLIYEPVIFADFTARLRFRTLEGKVERMAGLAFRLLDESNYYVLRASSIGNSFRFYKVVNGVRSEPIGPSIPIPSGEWHTLEVTCRGNSIRCGLDGRETIPALTDSSFSRGRLAFWTKSDSVSQFASLDVTYDVVKGLPERLVERAMERYPRLKGVEIYGRQNEVPSLLASSEKHLESVAAPTAEMQALETGQVSVGTASDHAAAVFPLRDRNGDPLFAVRIKMRTFRGQTADNITARGRIIAMFLEDIVRSADVADTAVK